MRLLAHTLQGGLDYQNFIAKYVDPLSSGGCGFLK
jgi:hypothetical protein